MRALVLSGGGPLAVAWESGLLAGLADAGVAAADADFILGTSAGAIVGAQLITGRPPSALAAAILNEENGVPPPGARQFDPAAVDLLPALFAKALAPGDRAAARAEVGAQALAAQTPSEAEELARFSLLLGGSDWSDRGFGCVAVDVENGEVSILTRDSGGSLVQAVAASCSLPGISPPITIQGRRYIDGGFGSVANADLVQGYDEVLVLCFRPAGPSGERMAARLEEQVAQLRAAGASVDVLFPDAATQEAIGVNMMDVRRRAQIARLGIAQGKVGGARLAV